MIKKTELEKLAAAAFNLEKQKVEGDADARLLSAARDGYDCANIFDMGDLFGPIQEWVKTELLKKYQDEGYDAKIEHGWFVIQLKPSTRVPLMGMDLKPMQKGLLLVLLFLLLSFRSVAFEGLCSPYPATGLLLPKSIWLHWERSDYAMGYVLFIGPESGIYTREINVGMVRSYKIDVLPGKTYFAVKAYNLDGRESIFSEEISYTYE